MFLRPWIGAPRFLRSLAPPKSRGAGATTPFALAAFALVALAMAANFLVWPGRSGAFGAALFAMMAAVVAMDVSSYRIPNCLNLGALVLGLVQAAAGAGGALAASVVFAFARGLILASCFFVLRFVYAKLRSRAGLGLGDVKLAAVAGVWLSFGTQAMAVEIAAVAALLFYSTRQFARGRALEADARLPFGAFFAPAIWLGWVFEHLAEARI